MLTHGKINWPDIIMLHATNHMKQGTTTAQGLRVVEELSWLVKK